MSDWFGSIGKDLSGFVGEVTKSVQSQVSQLQEANGNHSCNTNHTSQPLSIQYKTYINDI